jgi:hypothetical protein
LGVETTVAATGTKMAVGAVLLRQGPALCLTPFRAHPISLSLSLWSRWVQAWQVNKNTLVKGKIGNSAFSFLVAAKSYTALRLVLLFF